jgi:integrase
MKYLNYKPARISRGKKWYVSFQFLNKGMWKKFKVYHNINRFHDKDEKEEFAQALAEGVNRLLKEGFNPFDIDEKFKEEEPKKIWTLGQGLNYFKQKLTDRGLRKRSIQSYQSVLRMLNKNLAAVLHKDISTINKTHIQAALSGNDWGNTTYNNNITFVKAIFNYLIDAEILKENPAARIKPLPETITKHKYFDDKTWEKIKKKADPQLLDFILFMYHTGTRPNEARQIKYEYIKGDQMLIPASISKNRKDGYIPISKYIQDKYKGNGFIFGTSVNYFNQKFQVVKKDLKLGKDYTLYSVKHTRALHLAKDGASPYSIMSLFRHHSLEVTMRYLRELGLQMNREAVEKGIKF